MLSLSSHVLDTTKGLPAVAMNLTLHCPDGRQLSGMTNEDGRFSDWQEHEFTAGAYTLRFDTGSYLQQHHGSAFYPHVDIAFVMAETGGHYHIPLLISPFGFSSYRGS